MHMQCPPPFDAERNQGTDRLGKLPEVTRPVPCYSTLGLLLEGEVKVWGALLPLAPPLPPTHFLLLDWVCRIMK